jgi:hypothetical protein
LRCDKSWAVRIEVGRPCRFRHVRCHVAIAKFGRRPLAKAQSLRPGKSWASAWAWPPLDAAVGDLHRVGADKRTDYTTSPWEAFEKRLRYCVAEISREPSFSATARVDLGDARYLRSVLQKNQKFDVILTSPPYGDSRTTVQYGAASALCLEFASRIEGLEDPFIPGKVIDASCLGGSEFSESQECPVELRRYWAGGQRTYRSSRLLKNSTRLAGWHVIPWN